MKKRRTGFAVIQLMKTLGTDRLSMDQAVRLDREYNPWSAPLVAHIDPDAETAVTVHPEFPL
jgi:hypothetical protein